MAEQKVMQINSNGAIGIGGISSIEDTVNGKAELIHGHEWSDLSNVPATFPVESHVHSNCISITSGDSPYTIGNLSSNMILFADSSGGDIDIILPLSGDNQNREITIVHQKGGNLVTVSGNSIDGLASIELPKERDRLKVIGTGTEWVILEERISCQLRLDTYAGYGSVDNKIMRFVNERENFGNMFSENHSSGYNSNAQGLEITINRAGKYAFSFSKYYSTSGPTYSGLSLNSSQLTSHVKIINVEDLLTLNYSSGYNDSLCWVGYLKSGDIVRPHTYGSVPNYDASNWFTATYLGQ